MSKSKHNFKYLLKDLKNSEKRTEKKINASQKLSLCMIVKDEEKMLAEALESAIGVVDEIIIVDTGSTDKTVKIARKYGAKVYFKAWENNFATARNESLKHATGDWVLIMDADERIPKDRKDFLRSVLIPSEEALCYSVYIKNIGSAVKGHYITRLFRRTDESCFVGGIHEQLTPKSGEVSLPEESFYLEHYGYSDNDTTLDKVRNRNAPILKAEIDRLSKDHPLYSFYAYYIGVSDLESTDEILEWLTISLETAIDPHLTYLQMVYSHLVELHLQRKERDESLEMALEALKWFPELEDLPYFLSGYGRALFYNQQIDEGIEQIQKAIEIRESEEERNYFNPVQFDMALWSLYTNLGLMYAVQDKNDLTEDCFQKALAATPPKDIKNVSEYIYTLKDIGKKSVVDFMEAQMTLGSEGDQSSEFNLTHSLSNIYLKEEKPYDAVMLQSIEYGAERAILSALDLAQIYQRSARYDLSKQVYKAILDIDPKQFSAILGLQTVSWIEAGVQNFSAEDFETLKACVDTFDSACVFADFLVKVGALDYAEQILEQALSYENDEGHCQALKMQALILQLNHQLVEAEEKLVELSRIFPNNRDVKIQLGNFYLAQEIYAPAQALFQGLIEQGDDWYVYYALSICNLGLSNQEKALELLEKSIEIDGAQQASLELKILLEQPA